MKIKIIFFASCREIAGKSQADFQLKTGEKVAGLLQTVKNDFPLLSTKDLAVAVNQEFAGPDYELHDGDEVALLPPVSGG